MPPPPMPPKPTNTDGSQVDPASTRAPEIVQTPEIDSDTSSEDDSVSEFDLAEFQRTNPIAISNQRVDRLFESIGNFASSDVSTLASHLTPGWLKGWFSSAKKMVAKVFGPPKPNNLLLPPPIPGGPPAAPIDEEHNAVDAPEVAVPALEPASPAQQTGVGVDMQRNEIGPNLQPPALPRPIVGLHVPPVDMSPQQPPVPNVVVPQQDAVEGVAPQEYPGQIGQQGSNQGNDNEPMQEINQPSIKDMPDGSNPLPPEIVAALTEAIQDTQQLPPPATVETYNAPVPVLAEHRGRPPVALPAAAEPPPLQLPQPPEMMIESTYPDLDKMFDFLMEGGDNSGPPLLPHDLAEDIARIQAEQFVEDAGKEYDAISAAGEPSDDYQDLPVVPYNPSVAGKPRTEGLLGEVATLPNPGVSGSEDSGNAVVPVGPFDKLNKGVGLAVGAVAAVAGLAGTYWMSDKIRKWWKKKKSKEQKVKEVEETKVRRRHARDWSVAVDY